MADAAAPPPVVTTAKLLAPGAAAAKTGNRICQTDGQTEMWLG